MIFGLVPRRLTGGDKDYYDGTIPFAEWFENLERVIHTAEAAGFKFMAISQMQGLAIMARMAAVPTKLRFVNETLTLPMLDPVQLAPAAAYVDQMLEGRLDLGVSIGYRPWDLQAAGITRKDRVPKFVESIEIIKRMWTQDEVEFHGKYFDFEQLKPLAHPYQKPRPRIVVSSQAHGSAARAGRIADGICVAPPVYHNDVNALAETFTTSYRETNGKEADYVNARRNFFTGPDPREASVQAGKKETYLQFGPEHNYLRGQMQESTMVKLHLEAVTDVATDHAFCGRYSDMADQMEQILQGSKLTHMTCSFYNLPETMEGRLEFLNGFGEQVIAKFR